MKLSVAGKGGVGKTTIAALLALELASRSSPVLAVDCDSNPMLAESFGLDSSELERFAGTDGLRRAGNTLALAREPSLVAVAEGLCLLSGPPSRQALADAVARGIGGVLISDRFEHVITDLGAGPEFVQLAVGGALNPAELCVVVTDGRPVSELTAGRIVRACERRAVASEVVLNPPGLAARVAQKLAERLTGAGSQ